MGPTIAVREMIVDMEATGHHLSAERELAPRTCYQVRYTKSRCGHWGKTTRVYRPPREFWDSRSAFAADFVLLLLLLQDGRDRGGEGGNHTWSAVLEIMCDRGTHLRLPPDQDRTSSQQSTTSRGRGSARTGH